jgi:hypothetical protein
VRGMLFDEFEKATPEQLRHRAKECFNAAMRPQVFGDSSNVTSLLEAQFYMQELDRREAEEAGKHTRWIENRDFWLETVVIILIGAEIILSIWGIRLAIQEGRDEQTLMNKQNAVLDNLAKSSAATANALQTLQGTTDAMNTAVHNQLARTSLPNIWTSFLLPKHQISIANRGSYDSDAASKPKTHLVKLDIDLPRFI